MTATPDTKKPPHRLQPAEGVVPTSEEKNVSIIAETGQSVQTHRDHLDDVRLAPRSATTGSVASLDLDQIGELMAKVDATPTRHVVEAEDGRRWTHDHANAWMGPDGVQVCTLDLVRRLGFACTIWAPLNSSSMAAALTAELSSVVGEEKAFRLTHRQEDFVSIAKFPAPTKAVGAPSWATVVGPWMWVVVDDVWQRSIDAEIGGNVLVQSWQRFDAHGRVSTDDEAWLSVTVEGDQVDVSTPEDARRIADELYAAADVLACARGAGHRRPGTRPANGVQRAFTSVIREQIKARGVNQNEFAIGAGFGPDEFSALMTGGSLMDTRDVTLIATALGLDPFELLATAAGVER